MNQDYKITVDIYCNWQAEFKSYRIYIDDDLLTERTYIWNNPNEYVQEIIIVNLAPGSHRFILESIDKTFQGFYYTNFKVNGMPAVIKNREFTI